MAVRVEVATALRDPVGTTELERVRVLAEVRVVVPVGLSAAARVRVAVTVGDVVAPARVRVAVTVGDVVAPARVRVAVAVEETTGDRITSGVRDELAVAVIPPVPIGG